MVEKSPDIRLALDQLKGAIKGELHYDEMMRSIYATDASEYREYPIAITYPKDKEDIKTIIKFASQHKLSIIPRAAGTSLAGQCVGNGIIVDISKYWNKILKIDIENEFVIVQPGVIRDQLNEALKAHGYFFSPITSTANRAMIGGMVGNNSSGTTSIKYGVTRDKVISMDTILSDGTEVQFEELEKHSFQEKLKISTLEGIIYQQLFDYLKQESNRLEIINEFPNQSIHRRNTGYAVDELLNNHIFGGGENGINLSKLLCGSEGTLAFTTAIKLKIDPLPPNENSIIAIHFTSIKDSLLATQIVMNHQPYACELMDKIILDCTKSNIEQLKNRWFVEGDPQALLLVECRGNTPLEVVNEVSKIIADLKESKLGYAYPLIPAERTKNVWQLRSAGLGLLANLDLNKRAVACIEDTAVTLEDLPKYIEEFDQIMHKYGQNSVYYAHAGAGELHLRPILDLREPSEVDLFEKITRDVAILVKKYRGSLSGEHGDGRVRASFIPLMIGERNYQFLKDIKHTWDPKNIFNPGKIIDPKSMKVDLRSQQTKKTPAIQTFINFNATNGIYGLAAKCNGSGDCRKLPLSGGTMCPSYQVSLDEKDTTRARANVLREFLTKESGTSPFDHEEINEVMDLCISCKGCKSECPSNVDMALLKAETQFQWNKIHGTTLRKWVFSRIDSLNAIMQIVPRIANSILETKYLNKMLKSFLNIAQERDLPKVHKFSLRSWYKKNYDSLIPKTVKKEVVLFCDEFTNRLDVEIGIKAIKLLSSLGYKVLLINHNESGRSAISKGSLIKARKHAIKNINTLYEYANSNIPIVGIEPSAILSFRDEYPVLIPAEYKNKATLLAQKTYLIDEFLFFEIDNYNIDASDFDEIPRHIVLHGHCHQKALSKLTCTQKVLTLPLKHTLEVIPSGCCGMAGSFGYEKEHYKTSMKIGELVLFPAVRKAKENTIIVANGTSCRHQIMDGTERPSLHLVELLYLALKTN